ncbi:MAG: Eco57I restriction-modification methylase domain-containing protein [Sandaracinaceae bacterium]|nr:Eco57I restriction-modification methylase domain-containing protein [Sandaracinaceae bacterium]
MMEASPHDDHLPLDSLPTAGRKLRNLDLVETTDVLREQTFAALDERLRSELGQFGTPAPVAKLMASMFLPMDGVVRLLDAGAGVGSLTAAFVAEVCGRAKRPRRIEITAVEADNHLIEALTSTLQRCAAFGAARDVEVEWEIVNEDFIEFGVRSEADLFGQRAQRFTCAIQNPPYRKIRTSSRHRKRLRSMGIEVSNLYAGFVALTLRMLGSGGQLVAITPRSFCNGPYFDSFRTDFLGRMSLRAIHLFDSRSEAFGGDAVLQENIITHAIAGREPPATVAITTSSGEPGAPTTIMEVGYDLVVPPEAAHPAIHVISDGISMGVADRMQAFTSSLHRLGLQASTGRVVDFRAKEHLRADVEAGDAPLIYPMHLRDGGVRWPVDGARKPNGIANSAETASLLVPPGTYVLTKRFSSKEQRRRVEAFVYDSTNVAPGPVGFENHVNYIHEAGEGLESPVALGLFVYLNSTLLDMYFRLFSGHTQVNATDLRNLPFPDVEALRRVGARVTSLAITQDEIDELFDEELVSVAKRKTADPVASMKRVQEAQAALKALGLPSRQTNVRSALVLLSLLDLKRADPWSAAGNPMRGITELMDWFAEHYGKRYKPNTRETVRRQTVHQFLEAGLLVQNPDDPGRAVNSKDNVYQVVPEALAALRTFGPAGWDEALATYKEAMPALREVYAQKREMKRIPVKLANGTELSLSPGGQNVLVEQIIEHFVPRFAPGARVVYIGDTEDKWAYLDEGAIGELGLSFDTHGKFPDVVVEYTERNWLLLIEAVTSHGPVDAKRHKELRDLFGGSSAGLVFVTTFLTRRDLAKYLNDISWETEVWVAEAPGHMIHFDGKRFLGPYESAGEETD